MKYFLLTLIGGLMLGAPIKVQAASLDEANRAFAAGHFHDSTVAYQAVVSHNGFSAPVLYDLGNSLYREGNLAGAIVAYKRAQWLAPGDPDIAANLAQAQKQAGLAVVEPGWADKLGGVLSASQWAWLASAAWVVFCAGWLARALFPRQRALGLFACVLSAFVLLDAVGGMVLSARQLREAVITDKNAAALISPFPAAQKLFSPAAGDTVVVQKSYEDFDLVTDSSGHTGWISKAQITPVVPNA